MGLQPAIAQVINRKDLTFEDAQTAMNVIMSGEATPAQIGSYLTALRMKGETVDEIAGSASSMRSHVVAVPVDANIVGDKLADTCGTGGDGKHTFNISTTAAFVVAGAGLKVAKHGNRAASSKSGSADVLLALGLSVCSLPSAVLMLLWVLALAARPALMARLKGSRLKNLLQVAGMLLGAVAVIALVISVPLALLSSPDMRIEGNGSSSYFYRWFVDVLGEDAHTPWVLSVPLWVYRAAMLGWSLWLAFALIRWVRDAWAAYSQTGLWFSKAEQAAPEAS